MLKIIFSLLVMAAFLPVVANAVPTQIVVRVKAKDAKFIGTSVGGALVTIKDANTGELLAKGFTRGGTGDTRLIMNTPITRGMSIAKGAAKFHTVIDIDEPRLVEISAKAPYAQQQALQEMRLTMWLIPGKHIVGDGIIFEMPGFIVDILAPPVPTKKSHNERNIKIVASVSPMCGCPINPNTFWHPNSIEVAAIIKRDGRHYKTVALSFSGKTNIFEVELKSLEKGTYEIIVYAFDPKTGNTGVGMSSFVLS